MSIPNVKDHKELLPREIEKARQIIENLPSEWPDPEYGVDFSHLHEESQGKVIFVYMQTPQDQTSSWVAFELKYIDSGQDTEQLPDPEL
jgi:hypothetical protein